jgi:hypothetical protein
VGRGVEKSPPPKDVPASVSSSDVSVGIVAVSATGLVRGIWGMQAETAATVAAAAAAV